MSGGGSSKRIAPLAAPAPIPTPEDVDIEAQRKGEDLRRKLRAKAGRGGTIITEPTLGEPAVAKSTILGRTA